MICTEAGCDAVGLFRGLCKRHYNRAWYHHHAHGVPMPGHAKAGFVNPLVCVCLEPKADPRVNFGECATCRRKPLALMGAPA